MEFHPSIVEDASSLQAFFAKSSKEGGRPCGLPVEKRLPVNRKPPRNSRSLLGSAPFLKIRRPDVFIVQRPESRPEAKERFIAVLYHAADCCRLRGTRAPQCRRGGHPPAPASASRLTVTSWPESARYPSASRFKPSIGRPSVANRLRSRKSASRARVVGQDNRVRQRIP